jgi:hypothetical protein
MSDMFRLRLVFALLMSLLMSSMMSGWVTWLNIGLHPDFLARWRYAFMAAWPAAFTVVMVCGPLVHGASQNLARKLRRQ